MTVKQNTFYAITTYEVETVAAAERCFTNIDNNDHCVKSVRIRSYSVRMPENTDQNNSEQGHFLRSG